MKFYHKNLHRKSPKPFLCCPQRRISRHKISAENLFSLPICDMTEEKELIEKLKAAGDTEIRYVLCMWQDNSVDIPSFAFRKMLCELDQKNQEAALFVMTTEDISAIKMSVTMK